MDINVAGSINDSPFAPFAAPAGVELCGGVGHRLSSCSHGLALHRPDEAFDHIVHRHAFGFGAVIQKDAMSERGLRERLNVLLRHVRMPAQEGATLAPSTRYCPARNPAPQLTHSFTKSETPACRGLDADASRTA